MRDEARCAETEKIRRIDRAFRTGDMAALRAAVDDAAAIPNGILPIPIGSCLVYAIYHSPLAFIRTLLEIGADPNAPTDDGFPPLIAALSSGQQTPGTTPRQDVHDVLRLLLAHHADPNQRGINDYTALHMAIAVRDPIAVRLLLDAGASVSLRTRIDDCESALEMARAAGAAEIVAILENAETPRPQRLRSGVVLLDDVPGAGEPVRRQQRYRVRLRMWVADGRPVRTTRAWGPVGAARLEDEGATLITEVRLDRRSLVNGLFYGIDGMHVGGTRRLAIAPHMAYGDRGVPGVIPPDAALTVEITVLKESGLRP